MSRIVKLSVGGVSDQLPAKNDFLMPVFQLTDTLQFPPPYLAREDGLLAVGGDLSAERLLLAYTMGIFPWYSNGDPILWWAPSPRLILKPEEFRVPKRLARVLRKGVFHMTIDEEFRQVIRACAEIRHEQGEGTWITDEMIEAYCQLHDMGYAHSVESWKEGRLAGGLYGISMGTAFFGESMFSRESDSSKAALAVLVERLLSWNFEMIDCQVKTKHLERLGAREIPGDEFYPWLQRCLTRRTRRGKWQL